MKIISMYLPQFHHIKENDEWWGKGFTEWVTVKNAKKLYDSQYQPHIPLHGNYYDLLERKTLVWQAELMEQYGIDGQCFYHYWFKDGRQILEKPAQNLFRWKEINMPFCFCWANESWARSWSNIGNKNTWANIYEKEENTKLSGVLLEQKYGDEEQWKRHFEYLLPFFRDPRYIKIDGSPVFMIYKSALIPCLGDMIGKWKQWAAENGLDGIYLIGANSDSRVNRYLDAILYHEPQHSVSRFNYLEAGRKDVQRLNYDKVWEELLRYNSNGKTIIYGGFVSYDDTPRRGREGLIIEGATPEKFKKYLTELLAKNHAQGNGLTFLNAWNEWGEGMYLEPDEQNKYGYLEAIRYAKEKYKEYIYKYQYDEKNNISSAEVEFWAAKSARFEGYWRILDKWLCLKEEKISLEGYFSSKNMYAIAVYGVGILGRHLMKELEDGSVQIMYGIDRKADALHMDIRIYAPEDDFPEVDGIVVCVSYDYTEIREQLEERGYRNILSLEKILFEDY